jgi:release factor glutamine methyltransferase
VARTGFLTIKSALQQGTKLLEDSGVAAPRLTAEVLLSHALRRERIYLYGHPEEELTELAWIHYGRYLHHRANGKPTQYITRRQEFFGRDFKVTPDVLIPRPETEHVVAAAVERLAAGDHMIDVGCGSGAIAVTIALEKSVLAYASDVSAAALRVARYNAASLGACVRLIHCHLLSAIASRSMQMVISNPPYVGFSEEDGLQREVREYEPHIALFAGPEGTEIYAELVADAARVLRPGGWLILELGWKSLDRVRAMFGDAWTDIEAVPDLAGIPRVLCARYAP